MAREPARRRGRAAQVVDHVAQFRRLLEVHLHRLGLHLVFQRGDRLARAAFEEITRRHDARAVVVEGDLAHARRGAFLDDRREAMLEIVLARLERPAGAQAEFVAHQVKRRTQRPGVRERPEVARAVVLAQPGQLEARDRVDHVDLHQQEALVVAQRDVVARTVFLDEAAFQQQRLGLALDGVRLEVPDALDQRTGLHVGRLSARGHEVTAQPLAQAFGLADVDDAVEPVTHQVHAGPMGHVAQLALEVGLGLGQRGIHGAAANLRLKIQRFRPASKDRPPSILRPLAAISQR